MEYKYSLRILSCYNLDKIMPDQIDYAAMPIEYRLPDSLYSYPSDGPYERFLYLTEDWYDFSHKNDDIRKGIQLYCSEKNQYTDLFKGRGDYLIPNSNKVAAQILYGEEAKGRWADIPLVVKKSWLLPTDDPFLLTEMPTMVYDKDWFPNLDGTFNTIDTAQLSEMLRKNCLNDEMVLGACVWYPLKHDDGIIYYEIAEIGSGAFFLGQINAIERCLGNFGLLNVDLCEMCTGQYGAQLFKLAMRIKS